MGQIFDSDEHSPLGLQGSCATSTTQTVHHHDRISPAEDVPPSQSDSGNSYAVINVPVDTSLPQVAPPKKTSSNMKSHAKTATGPIYSGETKIAVKRCLSGEYSDGSPAKKMTKDGLNTIQATLKVETDDVENIYGEIKFGRGRTQVNSPEKSSSRPDSTFLQVNATATTSINNTAYLQMSNKRTPEKSPANKNYCNKDMTIERECPICMESLGSKQLASTICGHIFCIECIHKAMNTPGGKKCPTCRKTLKKGKGYHPLFI